MIRHRPVPGRRGVGGVMRVMIVASALLLLPAARDP